MQTFLPYPDFRESAKVLDYRRLGKQRVEAMQILNTIITNKKAWSHHPAVLMWRSHTEALGYYMNCMIDEWKARGYNNTMDHYPLGNPYSDPSMPWWMGYPDFHKAHQSNLLRKDPKFYGSVFYGVPNDLPYIWPVSYDPKTGIHTRSFSW